MEVWHRGEQGYEVGRRPSVKLSEIIQEGVVVDNAEGIGGIAMADC